MPDTTQQVAYIPMIFPDADFSRSEVNPLPLIQSIDKSVRELRQESYERERGNQRELELLNKGIANLERDSSEMRAEVNDLKRDVAELKGEIKTLNACIDGMDKRCDGMDKRFDDMTKTQNGWFLVLGFLVEVVPIAVTVVQYFVKH